MHYREATFQLERAAAAGSREVPVTVSSEDPCDRGSYVEILDHQPGSVDLSRAPLPLIIGHDTRQVNIGVVDKLHLQDRKLQGFARFGSSQRAQEVLKDVLDGIVTNVSIGYVLLDEGTPEGDRALRFKFKPHEVSVVSVPADNTVGFYRSKEVKRMNTKENLDEELAEKGEVRRVKQLVAIGHAYAKYIGKDDVKDAIERGLTEEQFCERIMSRMESKHTDTRELGMTGKEINRYSLSRAIVASLNNDWSRAGFEREASQACAQQFGRNPEGFYVPVECWKRDFNVGTSSEAGNFVATNLRTDLYTDALRNELQMARLGVRFLTGLQGNVDIPRKLTASSLAMLTEIGSASETNPTSAKVSLSPKRIGAYVEYSKQALIQSTMALDSLIRDDLITGAAVLLEDQAINGAGTGANMRGIRNTTSIGTTTAGANGATLAWSHLTDLEAACTNANASPNALAGYLTNTKVRAKGKNVQRGTNMAFIIDPDIAQSADGMVRVNGYRVGFSNNVPSNLTKGTSTTVCSAAIFSADWSMGVVALFGPPDVTVDPYTLAATGQVRVTLNQYADFGVRQPAAFAKIEDILTA